MTKESFAEYIKSAGATYEDIEKEMDLLFLR